MPAGPDDGFDIPRDEDPTEKEAEEENEHLLRRQRGFREAASFVASELAKLPVVEKVVLFGSVATPLDKEVPRFRKYRRAGVQLWHECKDIDLAVWVSRLDSLKSLQKARSWALNQLLESKSIGVAHHQVDVSLMETGTDRYLGRLCDYGVCPKGKRECLVPGCGASLFLRQHEDFIFDANGLAPEKSATLFVRGTATRGTEPWDGRAGTRPGPVAGPASASGGTPAETERARRAASGRRRTPV